MYKVSVKIAKSLIDGMGVFTEQNITKGNIVWIFTPGHDTMQAQSEFNLLPQKERLMIEKTGYLSPWSKHWIFPPADDPAQFTNHSRENNLSVAFDDKVSPEPYFVANRNINEGEELTNNYHEFDTITQETQPSWAS